MTEQKQVYCANGFWRFPPARMLHLNLRPTLLHCFILEKRSWGIVGNWGRNLSA